MEITVAFVAFSMAFATILWCVWTVVNSIWLRPKKLEKLIRRQGFSGNSYKLFHGDMKEMSMMRVEARAKPLKLSHDISSRILPYFHHAINKYGKKSFIWMGPKPTLNISDPKLIREILSKWETFQKLKSNPLARLVATGMVAYEGEQWVKARKIATPAFHLDKLKDMLSKMHLSCSDMTKKWKALVSEKDSCELDVWPHIQTLTADVISRTAFGSSYEDGRKIFELFGQQIKLFTQVMQFVYIPGWRFLPTTTNRKMKSNHNQIRALIKGIIKKKEEALKAGKASVDDDLLGILVASNHREMEEQGNQRSGMSIEEVIEECKLFYLAGQETTASWLVWTIVLLCMHQDWQERARKEVFEVFGDKEPQFAELNQLKEISKILYEALRLYSPASLLIRICQKETKLGEFTIPAGVLLSLPIILIHHEEEYWGEDVKEFNPDRFSQGVSKAAKNGQVSFFPFGWGPRICIGQNFAWLEAKLTLAMILRNFSFHLSPTYVHAPNLGITVQPQHGAHIILHKI
ncbi:cytochrome P450 CYP72A219-like [Mangifera indica]|uniref:cytochrome P450 CYP72A219-like n=1 Tax=Mangifera indica TaxID=29780 RepID=UPI001CFB43F2|nr:cytochrome P450 CYP72A219-like [Mangifera indica]